MADRARKQAERRGRRSEQLAALLLRLKLYQVLDSRVKTPVGEIDLIARRGNTICFIEVKSRRNRDDAARSVSHGNWQRIAAAADFWMKRHPQFSDDGWRYDLIAIGAGTWPQHMRGAWRPGDVF